MTIDVKEQLKGIDAGKPPIGLLRSSKVDKRPKSTACGAPVIEEFTTLSCFRFSRLPMEVGKEPKKFSLKTVKKRRLVAVERSGKD
jgi:hypothetical protein